MTAISAGGVALDGLRKSFGAVKAVQNVDLLIAPGEVVALLGPNGAGKSTTLDMLLGLTRPDAGSVSIFGLSPVQAVQEGCVGGMLQTGSLMPEVTPRELFTMVASLYPKPLRVEEVIEFTGTGEIVDRRCKRLSGGETQRVRFGIALVANPDLLILDEPTVALDVEGRRDFWAAMRSIAGQGKTIIFATHYLEEADTYGDRIVVMARGRIVADGPGTEIKARAGMRTIRATLPGADLVALAKLPGVVKADTRGEAVVLNCSDSDTALRHLLATYAAARDIEVRGAGLEEAFLELTSETAEDGTRTDTPEVIR